MESLRPYCYRAPNLMGLLGLVVSYTPAYRKIHNEQNTQPDNVADEIDIMEWVSCFDKGRVQPNFHLWGDFNGKKNNHTQYSIKNQLHFDVTKWHVYSAKWDKTKLIVRVDGQTIAKWYAKDYPVWPFDYTYELLMDVAYGGWGATCGFDLSTLPQSMQVDWIKYYSLKR